MKKGYNTADKVMFATLLAVGALHGGLEPTGSAHGWRVDGDMLPAAEEVVRTTSTHIDTHREDREIETSTRVGTGGTVEEDLCVIPATQVTRIDFETHYKDWTLPYGLPFLVGGTLLSLAVDSIHRKQKMSTPKVAGSRPNISLGELGVAGAVVLAGSAALFGVLTQCEPSPPKVKPADYIVGEGSRSVYHDPCEGADREVVRVTAEETVTYRDGQLQSTS